MVEQLAVDSPTILFWQKNIFILSFRFKDSENGHWKNIANLKTRPHKNG